MLKKLSTLFGGKKKTTSATQSLASGEGSEGLFTGLPYLPPEPGTRNMRDIRSAMFYMAAENTLKVSSTIQQSPEFYSFREELLCSDPEITIEYLDGGQFEFEKQAQITMLSEKSRKYTPQATRHTHEARRIIRDAAKMNASDIHIDIVDGVGVLQYRIGGMLRRISELEQPLEIISTIVNTLAETKDSEFSQTKMQDGVIAKKENLPSGVVAVRIVTAPCYGGSYMVMRLQYEGKKENSELPLSTNISRLGYLPRQVETWGRIARKNSGIVIICGKVGSGKTQTLATIMTGISRDNPEKLIQTVENPIEIPLDNVRQLSLKTTYDGSVESNQSGLLQGIKVALRSDPNILTVSEVRAQEESLAAFQGADTGLLLFTTLHANSALAGLSRFQSLLPVESVPDPYLHMADPDFMAGVCYQRLVRVLCDHCKIPLARNEHRVSREMLERIKRFTLNRDELYASIFIEGEGCDCCDNLGYKGRTVLAEVISFDTQLLSVYGKTKDIFSVKQAWLRSGGVSYRQVGQERVLCGMISPKEYESHCGDIDQREAFDLSLIEFEEED